MATNLSRDPRGDPHHGLGLDQNRVRSAALVVALDQGRGREIGIEAETGVAPVIAPVIDIEVDEGVEVGTIVVGEEAEVEAETDEGAEADEGAEVEVGKGVDAGIDHTPEAGAEAGAETERRRKRSTRKRKKRRVKVLDHRQEKAVHRLRERLYKQC